MELDSSKKARLVLELDSSEVVEGDFEKISGSIIYLSNVINSKTNKPPEENETVSYKQETIISIYKLTTKELDKIVDEDGTRIIKILRSLFDHYREMTHSFIYIDMNNEKLYKAINDLYRAESVSVVGLGYSCDRRKRLTLLGLSTLKQIYLIDLFPIKNQSMLDQLQGLFEDEDIQKIVHGPELYDYLKRRCNINMRNVFDTQVADLKIANQQKKDVCTCLTTYCNFPASLTKEASDKLFDEQWFKRPLNYDQMVMAAQLVVYLWKLRDNLKKIMLK